MAMSLAQEESMMASFSPDLAATFLPGLSRVPLAERDMLATLRSSCTMRS